MTTRPLITGSLAFDCVMRVDGRFAERLEGGAADAAFVAPTLRRLFGGCAGNIAYGLRLLGDSPLLMAVAGSDFSPYRAHLAAHCIDDSYVKILSEFNTAQAYLVADNDGRLINVFHPGATAEAHRQSVGDLQESPPLAIVSPNGLRGMLQFGRECAEKKTPFIFDPGQALGLFSAEELQEMMSLCRAAIFNQSEHALYEKIVGAPPPADSHRAVIVTCGEGGAQLILGDKKESVSAAVFGAAKDATGCGDAYRAGLIYGMLRDWSWPQSMRLASVVAGVKALCDGGQQYQLTAAEAEKKCRQVYG